MSGEGLLIDGSDPTFTQPHLAAWARPESRDQRLGIVLQAHQHVGLADRTDRGHRTPEQEAEHCQQHDRQSDHKLPLE